MRQIIHYIAIMLFIFPITSKAQLNIIKVVNKSETICDSNDLRGHSTLKYTGKDYYIYVHSTNQYDDVELMYIGDTKEKTLQTLYDIEQLFESIPIGDMVIVSDHHNQRITLYKSFNKQFQVEFETQAGIRCLSLGNIQDFITTLSSPPEQESQEDEWNPNDNNNG